MNRSTEARLQALERDRAPTSYVVWFQASDGRDEFRSRAEPDAVLTETELDAWTADHPDVQVIAVHRVDGGTQAEFPPRRDPEF